MKISKKIKISNNDYYAIIDVVYKKDIDNTPDLCLKDFHEDYWDGGDCSILIQEIEKNYTPEKVEKYDKGIGFMADVLYIYDRMPFISGIKDVYIQKDENLPYAEGYIDKEEIEEFINCFKVEMNCNKDFKLYDSNTWYL